MNRFDRIVALLILLQSRRVVTGPALADRFGVSLRTIYRDIRTLEQAGVPIIGEPNVGYSLADGYRLPPVLFTREEAAARLRALADSLARHNSVEFQRDGGRVTVSVPDEVKLKVEVELGEENEIEIELTW